jgi:predicted transcriptional regulator
MAASAKISDATKKIADELAHVTGEKQIDLLEKAMRHYQRYIRLQSLNEGYAKLRNDKNGWKKEAQERAQLKGKDEEDLGND